jgi:hypothetical protein
MDFLMDNWSEIVALLTGAAALWQRSKAKRAAKELDAIRTEAGTKAPWETLLSEQAREARARAKTPG